MKFQRSRGFTRALLLRVKPGSQKFFALDLYDRGLRNLVAPRTLSEITAALAQAGVPKFADAILRFGRVRE